MGADQTTEERAATPIRLLVVEDSPRDAELAVREIRNGGFDVTWKRVETDADMRAALDGEPWDAVLSDYRLPHFDGLAALRVLQERTLGIPFIIVSGTIGEETAVSALKAGADDYLMKDKLWRLGPALRRELREAESRRERARLARAVQFAEHQWETTFDAMVDAIALLDAEGNIARCNRSMQALVGMRFADIIGQPCSLLMRGTAASPQECPYLRARESGEREELEVERGERAHHVVVDPIRDEAGRVQGAAYVMRDITHGRAEQRRKTLAMEVLATLNRGNDIGLLVRDILCLTREWTGIEAAAIRLREGDDYPHYEADGFPDDFMSAERYLCVHGEDGSVLRDAQGHAVLACMCGNVISGRTDPAMPYFTEGGSFWSNCATDLQASMSARDRHACTRSRCSEEGYESVALIPLRSGGETVGLLQLNDRRRDRFTIETILFFEGLGAAVGIALARKRAKQSLVASESLKDRIVESSRDCIKVLDLEGRLLSMSRVGQEMLEIVDIEPYVGRNWVDFWHGADRTRALAAVDAARKGDVGQFEGYCETEKGNPAWWDVIVAPLRDSNGRAEGLLAVARNATERKGLEAERRAMEAQLRQSQKMESIGMLAGGVAHEINNPINGIMNYAQLILDRTGPGAEVSELATEIGKESERIATIVRNLLHFSRHDGGQAHGPVRACDVVTETLSLIRTVLRHDQITLAVDVPEDLPKIKCRSQQLQQVIMNLLTNARDALNVKYPQYDENKCIRISAAVIEKDGGTWVRTTVEDHGPGIPEAVRERMYEPFYTTKPRDKGTGLGLSISHGIVREHHGELSAESEIGQWTRFHVDLPIEDCGILEGERDA